ncbi:MAG: hypothetical protein VKO39_13355 [Cyanobacteriota bacterium]|nr:hypothetical protein [Cyanobacteriota bacterium]
MQNPGLQQISAKTDNRTPQGFEFGASLSGVKRDQINQPIAHMRFDGLIEALVKRWQDS